MMQERLQKILAERTSYSRRKAEQLIVEGRVSVNGKIAERLGTKVDPDRDLIVVDGTEVPPAESKVYYMLNKPPGVLCTMSDPQGRPIITGLLKEIKERIFPVGRLDMNSEGLLLLTNDGDLALRLQHPRFGVSKTYEVLVKGLPAPEQLASMRRGMVLEQGVTAPARVDLLKTEGKNAWIRVIIKEGKKRQVRYMCRELGLSVIRVKRVALDRLKLENLKMGGYRPLTHAEVELLKRAAPQPRKRRAS
jgi:23S rRNA pseudouridine2605 synthase